MKQVAQPFKRFRFGIFEADLRTGELTRLGKRVRLQEQPFRLLAMLLERPGELVIREELCESLWPKTIVDFDHGLNKAVSKVREALGDWPKIPASSRPSPAAAIDFSPTSRLSKADNRPPRPAILPLSAKPPVSLNALTPARQQNGRHSVGGFPPS